MNELIRALGVVTEVDRPERNDPQLQELLLSGKVKVERGATLWWLDENFGQHFARVEFDESMPQFEMALIPNIQITVRGIADYTMRWVH